jgi:peptidoglycan-N-acetylglucosamine deacetylase
MRRMMWLSLIALVAVSLEGRLPHTGVSAQNAARAPGPPRAAQIPAQFRGKIIHKRVRHFPAKLLALTFDDGPSPQITPTILKALRQYHAHATFFVVGRNAKAYPALVKQAAAEGHAIESHSWSHPSRCSPSAAASELAKTAAIIKKLTGRNPQLFRPPYGITTGNLCKQAQKQGYGVVLWTISTADSNRIGPSVIARNAIHTPNPGDFVLMHDGAGHKATAQALPQVLRELTAAGFRFVTMPRLLQEWARWQQQVRPRPSRK